MRRFGVSKLQNIIQKALASHVQKVKEKQDQKEKELDPIIVKEPEQSPITSSILIVLHILLQWNFDLKGITKNN